MILLFMESCASKQLRPKTMHAYEKTLRLFAKWLQENEEITKADAVKEMHDTEGAFLLEVRVEKEENVFPMVPAGQPVDKIRLE